MVQGMVSCPGCRRRFPTLAALNEHLDQAHPVEVPDEVPKINDRTPAFAGVRRRHLERMTLRRTRLELRLVKLLLGLQRLTGTDRAYSGAGGGFWNWQESKAIREFEEDVVAWEDEAVFERCRFCGQRFSLFLRKHHCRVCGLVTCGDAERECSLEVPGHLLAEKVADLQTDFPELAHVSTLYPVRLCTECRNTLLSHRNYLLDRAPATMPTYLRLHAHLQRIQAVIADALPSFQVSLAAVASQDPAPGEIARLRTARQSLLQQFSKYEQVMRRLRSLDVETDAEIRLRQQILAKAAQFLETTMVPLQSLPQAMRYSEAPTLDKHTANKLQNQLVVLEEQKFLLAQQVEQAMYKRHFDALPPLEVSLAEITSEAERISDQLGQFAPTN